MEDWDYNLLPLSSGGIPSEVFATERSLKLNGCSIGLKHYAPAHTDCDDYGFRTSDSDFDGWIWAFMYGAVSLGGLFRHALGVPSGEHVYLTPSAGILPVPSLI